MTTFIALAFMSATVYLGIFGIFYLCLAKV